MAFITEREKDLTAPNAERARWTAVVLAVALTVTYASVHRDVKVGHSGLRHTALGSRVKRDDARFRHHGNHSA